jgi:hypothetical protein
MEYNKKNRLALDMAEALNDKEALPLYLSFVEKYPEKLLKKILAKVLAMPENKIRKTRGALFNYLIHQHAEVDSRD